MTLEKLKSILANYDSLLRKEGFKPKKNANTYQDHILWMIKQVLEWDDSRKEKAMRWLGFIQGQLNAHGVFTIEQLKEHSKP